MVFFLFFASPHRSQIINRFDYYAFPSTIQIQNKRTIIECMPLTLHSFFSLFAIVQLYRTLYICAENVHCSMGWLQCGTHQRILKMSRFGLLHTPSKQQHHRRRCRLCFMWSMCVCAMWCVDGGKIQRWWLWHLFERLNLYWIPTKRTGKYNARYPPPNINTETIFSMEIL